MLVNLRSCAAKDGPQTTRVTLKERLPAHINSPCEINCQFEAKLVDNYYLLSLNVESALSLVCQRCLNEFSQHYANQTTLAICSSDEVAEKLMQSYECLVSQNNQIDLSELLSDELYLYGPEFHADARDCDVEMSSFIRAERE